MRAEWRTISNIIRVSDSPKDKFISLIAEDGTIMNANARMVRSLHIKTRNQAQLIF